MADNATQEKQANETSQRPTNCASCNKQFKRKLWYYKNGKFFCTKQCWKNFELKNKKTKEKETK